MIGGVQRHSRVGSLKKPQGQGFIAATSTKRAGKVRLVVAREIVTRPSSSGWRRTSRAVRRDSGGSSRNRPAVGPQRACAGGGEGAAADEPGVGDGVVGRGEGPRTHQAG